MANKNLLAAKKAKNDEFYTRLEDISQELQWYKDQFKDKVVLCNCDDSWSNFYKYFHLCFNFFGLKKLICTHYETDKPSYAYVYNGEDDNNVDVCTTVRLEGNGDFRNKECLDFLDEADIVVTNPPFSLFREFIATLEEHQKKYLVIGNKNAISYKEIFPLIKDDKMWLGYTSPSDFTTPEGTLSGKMGGLTRWFTNLDIKKRHEKLILENKYSPEKYPHYDNYDAINVDKLSDIPGDYEGVMGVPITYLDKHCPEQFEIVGLSQTGIIPEGWRGVSKEIVEMYYKQGSTGAIREGWINPMYIDKNGKAIAPYHRILIKKKQEVANEDNL